MKYIKTYEKLTPKYQIGDYVFFIKDVINGYSKKNLFKQIFIIENLQITSFYGINYLLKFPNNKLYNWVKEIVNSEEVLRPATETEIVATKYNL
jgi:hypothetical protein